MLIVENHDCKLVSASCNPWKNGCNFNTMNYDHNVYIECTTLDDEKWVTQAWISTCSTHIVVQSTVYQRNTTRCAVHAHYVVHNDVCLIHCAFTWFELPVNFGRWK